MMRAWEMKMKTPNNLGIVIGNKEEVFWNNLKQIEEQNIKNIEADRENLPLLLLHHQNILKLVKLQLRTAKRKRKWKK